MKKSPIFYSLLLGFPSVSLQASDEMIADAKARVLWSDFDGKKHALLVANYNGEDWSNPTVIHSSENPMTSVAVGSADDNTELLVWTEQIKQKSQLFHKWFSPKTQQWSEAELLSKLGDENIGASIVVDPSGRLHLFWAANETDFSDIAHMTYAKGQWSEPSTIHEPNDVPDIKPTASLSLNGNIVVSWSSYSFDAGQYVELEKIIETALPNSSNTTLDDAIEIEQVEQPNFLPNDSSATLYFPGNTVVQSLTLEP